MKKMILFTALFLLPSAAFCEGHKRQQGGVDLRQQKQIDAYYRSVLPGFEGGPTWAVPGYGSGPGEMKPTKRTPAVTINPSRRRIRYYPRRPVYTFPYSRYGYFRYGYYR